jgi:lysophospholipase L1-like esterase
MSGFGLGLGLGAAHRSRAGGGLVPSLPAMASIVGFGDSIAMGSAASIAANRWLNRVAAALGAGTPLNKAISGTVLQNSNDAGGSPRPDNGRDRYAADLLGANKREGVFVAYGFNDARYMAAPATLNLANYQNDLCEVLGGLAAGGYPRDRIVMVAPYWISDTGLTTGSSGFSGQNRAGFEAHVAAAQAVARGYGTWWADAYGWMRDHGAATLISGDHIHPNDAGHAAIAEAVLTATRQEGFLVDAFDGALDSDLAAHAPAHGGSWAVQSGYTPATPNRLDGAGRVYGTTSSGVYRATDAPPGPNYAVEAKLDCLTSLAGDSVGIAGRMQAAANTLYFVRFARSSNSWGLFKTVAGTTTQLGASWSDGFASGSRTVRLIMNGSSISTEIDGVLRIGPVTDSAIAGAGHAGMRFGGAVQTAATGIHIDRIVAQGV